MRAVLLQLVFTLATVLACAGARAPQQPVGVIRPFNGVDLEGWSGGVANWSVHNGELVGRTTSEAPLPQSTYLVWDGAMPADFELRCRVRIAGAGANSGIQYRSAVVPGQADMHGPQADLDAADQYTGALYEGLGRSLMATRGEQVEWTPNGKRVLARFAPDEVLRKSIRKGAWNEYRIEARGTRMRHWLNGTLMCDVTDGDASRFRRGGKLALQLHSGPPMEVRFADIEVRPLVTAPPVEALVLPEGFTAELLASAQPGQGSWVCIAFDTHGRAVISPQYGALLQAWVPGVSRDSAGAVHGGTDTEVRALDTPLRSAQGLCFAAGALFVNVAEDAANNGLWRLRDTDGDGTYDDATKLIAYSGDGGEHGAHAVVPGPDGMLYVALGNHTLVPDSIARPATEEHPGAAPGSPYDHFAEDLAGPRMWDPRGHAVGVRAPGGVVLRVDPATGAATLMAGGLRNAYDHCFNADGELFTYDSDMEWDMGAPWYRAPRVVHLVPGGEYGWRSSSGCWPAWYPDSLPVVCDTDSASPTGMVSGHESTWPEPWRSMLFCGDWTFGRILAVTLTADGGSYRGEWQPFITGRPMPVTDMAWGPDGQMYIVTGGRGTQSGLYRVRYTGAAPGAPGVASAAAAHGGVPGAHALSDAEAALGAHAMHAFGRTVCESMMRPLTPEEYVEAEEMIITGLDAGDRWFQHAARVALEHQPVEWWRATVAASPSARVRAAGALALARVGSAADAQAACTLAEALLTGAPPGAPAADDGVRLHAVRALQVAAARHPELRASVTMQGTARALVAASAQQPEGPFVWGALEFACACGVPAAVPAAVARLQNAADRMAATRYATMLRTTRDGWSDATREAYWQWLHAATDTAGGFSLGGFLEQIRRDARAHVGGEPARTGSAAGSGQAAAPPIAPPPARATGAQLHAWTVAELLAPRDDDGERDLARGAQVFRETTCILCHRFAGAGSSTGPDLTGVGGRFSREDLLRAILEPSAVVSDQYRDSIVETKDGSIIVGRIVADLADAVEVRTNPLGEDRERVRKSEIVSITPIETSSMPPGLLDARTRAEILDLLAYLERVGP